MKVQGRLTPKMLFITVFVFWCAACMQFDQPAPELGILHPSLTQTDTEAEALECRSELTRISSSKVYSFEWSPDGKEIRYTLDPEFYLKETEQALWHRFDIYANQSLPADAPLWESPVELGYVYDFIHSLSLPEDLIEMHVSPSGQRAIVSVRAEQSVSSEPIIIPEGTAPENADTHNLYFLDMHGNQIYLGRVTGYLARSTKTSSGQSQPMFEGVVWSNSENHAIVQTHPWSFDPSAIPPADSVGEALLWLVDIENDTLEVLYPSNRVVPNLFGISPGDQYVLYYSAGHFFYFDINEKTEHQTKIAVSPYVAWVKDELLVLFILNAERSKGDAVYLYNIYTGDFEVLIELGLPVQSSVLGAIQLSPDKTRIAFRTENNYELYYFNLCY